MSTTRALLALAVSLPIACGSSTTPPAAPAPAAAPEAATAAKPAARSDAAVVGARTTITGVGPSLALSIVLPEGFRHDIYDRGGSLSFPVARLTGDGMVLEVGFGGVDISPETVAAMQTDPLFHLIINEGHVFAAERGGKHQVTVRHPKHRLDCRASDLTAMAQVERVIAICKTLAAAEP